MRNTRKGFTIIEVTIAAAVSTVIMFGVFGILQVSNKQLNLIHAKMSLEEGLREALFKMTQEIRQTSYNKILDFGSGNPLNGSTINFRVPVPAPDASTLVDQNYSPLWAADINYSLNINNQIIRTSTEAGVTTQAVLANNITALTFSRANTTSGLITITTAAQQQLSDGRWVPASPLLLTVQAEARNP